MALDRTSDDRNTTDSTPPVGPDHDRRKNSDFQGSPLLNSQSTSSSTGPQLVNAPPSNPPTPTAVWIDRIGLVIRVVFYIELGMLLAVLPWTKLWTENGLVMGMPQLRAIVQMNFVRGLVTGVGLVDIWIGVWEAVRYREVRPT